MIQSCSGWGAKRIQQANRNIKMYIHTVASEEHSRRIKHASPDMHLLFTSKLY